MEVTDLSANTFWKGETEIKGTAVDGADRYRVRILRKGSQIFDYSCSHVDENGKKLGLCSLSCTRTGPDFPMCAHGQAVLESYLGRAKRENQASVSTSQKIRFMVREYTNREVSRIMGMEQEGTMTLKPRLTILRDQIRVRFFVGKDRFVPIGDLYGFVTAMETGQTAGYGKGISFRHSLWAFGENSRPLALLLMEFAGAQKEAAAQARRSAFSVEPVLKELVLGKAGRERFFDILEGQSLVCEDYRGQERTLLVKRENPKFTIEAAPAGRDGVRISLDKNLMAFSGEKSLFVADLENLFCCDEEYTDALTVFLEYLIMGHDAEAEVLINDRDMPLFYERVLRPLELLGLVEAKGLELETYRPKELKAEFYFDSGGPEEVTLRPSLSYGDYSFHPLEDEQVPKEICRDVPGEFKVSRVIMKYFRYAEDGTKNLMIRGDDEAVYQLLSEGIREFLELGDVFVSENLKKIKVLPPAKASVHVSAAEGWLDLVVDTGGIPREELEAVLLAYKRKKKYYRMKNGDFVTLDDGGLRTVSGLLERLGAAEQLLKGESIRLPKYRALFLDGALKADRSVSFYRDQLFKAMVRGLKDTEDSEFELPKTLDPVLRAYQKAGFRWLRCLDSYGFGGILADEMGLGKTVQILALLLDEKRRSGKTSLIVCPASLVYNWESEAARFAPELSVKVLGGNQAEREELLLELSESGFSGVDLVITSYDLLKRDLEYYRGVLFRFAVIDEAQYIKNSSTKAAKAVKSLNAAGRFALTGTPIENHLGELWSIFDFLMPGFLFTAPKFRKMFEIPVVKEGDQEALSSLMKLTGPFILRRLKKDVLKELPEKLETVLYSAMEGEQKRLYGAHAAALKERLLLGEGGGFGREKLEILSELMKLRQICCDPSLCFSGYRSGSAKLETCMELLENGMEAGHKILLFSQFTSMLDIIAKRLQKRKIPFYLLTGGTPKKDRVQMVSAFNKDEVKIFLISLKAGGTGLNLTAADVVIHYDPWWNVAAQNQATDRAHRIGQVNQVTVFKLITRHTVEENILKLQEKKKNLADLVVTEGTGTFANLTKEELLSILDG